MILGLNHYFLLFKKDHSFVYTSSTTFQFFDFYISVSSRYIPLHSSTYYTIFIIIQYKCWFLVGFSCVPAPLIALSSAFTFIHSIFLILSLVSKVWELHHLTSVQPNLYTYTHTALFLMLCHPFGRSSNNNNSTLLLLRVGMRSFVIWSSFYVTSPAAFKLQGVQTKNVQDIFQFCKKSVMYGWLLSLGLECCYLVEELV